MDTTAARGGKRAARATAGGEARPSAKEPKAGAAVLVSAQALATATGCPSYTRPKEVGTYSLDEHRGFRCGTHGLGTYRRPPLPADLLEGYPLQYIQRDRQKLEYIDHICQFLLSAQQQQEPAAEAALQADVVCFRGLLTKVMHCAHARREPLRFVAQRFGSRLYLCEIEEPPAAGTGPALPQRHGQRGDLAQVTADHAKAQYAGYKFEQVATASPSSSVRGGPWLGRGIVAVSVGPCVRADGLPVQVVNTNTGVCTVCTATLAGIRLLIAGR
jgi:hypothetical protein